ncbi:MULTISPECIES: PAS domain S-box protein [Halobacterium]|uniref:PAS domain S-box protein n=1 Tax=Halobacterium TaxID=2239 RepID=UPI00073EDB75|nr:MULTISPECIES: PAS domain S-box protein [Halobacterium]MCG1002820.1 PAS domain S-box protein [Halobacterium noricense]
MNGGTNATNESIRVLHVDDDEAFGGLASTYLERVNERLDVATVTSTTDALDHLADHDVDCVVSDYDMPEQNGIEFLEVVREDHPELPFVLFTGKGSEEVASDAISAGVTDYLQKQRGTEQYTVLANRVQNAVEKRRSERALDERNRRLETLISNLPGMVYRCRNDPDWPMEFVGGECEQLTGYAADALESGDVVWGEAVIHPDDREEMWEVVQDALADDAAFEVTYRIHTQGGNRKHVWERGRGIYDADGDLRGIEGFITDITQQHERQQRLERTSERFRALFENSPDMVNIHDATGTIVDANQRFCDELGYDSREVVGMNVWDIDTMAEPEGVKAMESKMDHGGVQRFDAEFERADGSTFPVEVHLAKLDVGGGPQFLAISRDVSEREAREAELRRLKRQYETVFENAQDGLFLLEVLGDGDDVEFVYRQLNPAHESMSGLDADEIRGQTETEAFAFDESLSRKTTSYHRQCYERREPVEFEEVFEFPAGDVAVSGTVSPVIIDGEVTHLVGVTRDVTEFKERERALRRERDRLEEFADILSHDLRNPLNVAEGNLEIARESYDSERLETVADAHDRMRALIDDVLALARQGRTATDLDDVALDAAAERAWASVETRAATLVADAELTVRADEGRLAQLLENLFRNSVEHAAANPPEDCVTVRVGALDDGFYVEDDGRGIPDGDRERVFEYAYSTNDDGTGLGLSIVAELADAHGWAVEVTDGETGGTRFEITGVERVA